MKAEALELSGALAAELDRPALNLTLYQIDTELAQLIEYRQERLIDTVNRPTEEEIAALDEEIQQYRVAGPAKVSGVTAIFRSWKAQREAAAAEVKRYKQIIAHYECMEARLKDYCAAILEKQPEPRKGCRKLVGADGSQLMLKGNGGLQPLDITDAASVPDELCVYVLKLAGAEWRMVDEAVRRRAIGLTLVPDRQPDPEAIRAALAQPCAAVTNGLQCTDGRLPNDGPIEDWPLCPACGGSGKHAVPGARLLERGAHVECR